MFYWTKLILGTSFLALFLLAGCEQSVLTGGGMMEVPGDLGILSFSQGVQDGDIQADQQETYAFITNNNNSQLRVINLTKSEYLREHGTGYYPLSIPLLIKPDILEVYQSEWEQLNRLLVLSAGEPYLQIIDAWRLVTRGYFSPQHLSRKLKLTCLDSQDIASPGNIALGKEPGSGRPLAYIGLSCGQVAVVDILEEKQLGHFCQLGLPTALTVSKEQLFIAHGDKGQLAKINLKKANYQCKDQQDWLSKIEVGSQVRTMYTVGKNSIYLQLQESNKLLVFDALAGKFLKRKGKIVSIELPGWNQDLVYAGMSRFRVDKYLDREMLSGQWNFMELRPAVLISNSNGNLYVVDPINHRLVDKTLIAEIGEPQLHLKGKLVPVPPDDNAQDGTKPGISPEQEWHKRLQIKEIEIASPSLVLDEIWNITYNGAIPFSQLSEDAISISGKVITFEGKSLAQEINLSGFLQVGDVVQIKNLGQKNKECKKEKNDYPVAAVSHNQIVLADAPTAACLPKKMDLAFRVEGAFAVNGSRSGFQGRAQLNQPYKGEIFHFIIASQGDGSNKQQLATAGISFRLTTFLANYSQVELTSFAGETVRMKEERKAGQEEITSAVDLDFSELIKVEVDDSAQLEDEEWKLIYEGVFPGTRREGKLSADGSLKIEGDPIKGNLFPIKKGDKVVIFGGFSSKPTKKCQDYLSLVEENKEVGGKKLERAEFAIAEFSEDKGMIDSLKLDLDSTTSLDLTCFTDWSGFENQSKTPKDRRVYFDILPPDNYLLVGTVSGYVGRMAEGKSPADWPFKIEIDSDKWGLEKGPARGSYFKMIGSSNMDKAHYYLGENGMPGRLFLTGDDLYIIYPFGEILQRFNLKTLQTQSWN